MNQIEQTYISEYIVKSVMPDITDSSTTIDHYNRLLNGGYKKPLLVMIDCSKTDFQFHPRDFDEMIDRVKSCIEKYGTLREAILVQSAYETGVADLFQNRAQLENYSFEVFSTESSAIAWLEAFGPSS